VAAVGILSVVKNLGRLPKLSCNLKPQTPVGGCGFSFTMEWTFGDILIFNKVVFHHCIANNMLNGQTSTQHFSLIG